MENLSKKSLKEFFYITIGTFLVSFGLFFFMMPSNIAAGGINGLAIVMGEFIPLSVGTIMMILNILLFIIAFIFLGSGFGAKTIYTSLGISLIIMVLEKLYPNMTSITGDLLLEIIIGIGITAIGIGIIFNQNASSGGTDIIGKIINKYIGLDFGKSVLLCDLVITILAFVSLGTKIGMYSIFGAIMNGLIIDYTIDGLNVNKEVTIISKKLDEIQAFIFDELERGATIYSGHGAYTKEEKHILKTVIAPRDFFKLKNFIREIDPEAFVTITHTSEVLGDGFKSIHD